MTRRQALAGALAAAAALVVNAGALEKELRRPPPPDRRGERTDRAIAALARRLPPGVTIVGWRAGPEPDAVPFQLVQYALVPRALAMGVPTEFVVVEAPGPFVERLARAEGLVEIGSAGGFHLLRRGAP